MIELTQEKAVRDQMAEYRGADLNPLFEELADWEEQLKPLDPHVFEDLGEPE